MIARQVALVPESNISVDLREIVRVAAALQKQATRDFSPIWEITATVDGFGALEDVPLGYWPVILVEDVPDAAGVHLDRLGQPFALVEVGDSWSLTASHETLEMLADPFGNRLVAGSSPERSQGRVEFLVEVCDPSEDERFAYTVNSVLVSDFYTPRYFDPVAASGVQYSFTGAITRPREVLQGGYLSWHNPPDDHWYQLTFFGSRQQFRDLGVLASDGRSLREIIDSLTPQTRRLSKLAPDDKPLRAAVAAAEAAQAGSGVRAEYLREQIRELARGQSEMPDSTQGRRQRADALRGEIDEIKQGSSSPRRPAVSPREFTDEAAAKAGADDVRERGSKQS
jgi:hypothetical protein